METADHCQDGSPVMPAGQRWLTKVKGHTKRCGQHWIQIRMQREGKLVCTIVTAEDWTTTVRYMLLTKALLNEYEERCMCVKLLYS